MRALTVEVQGRRFGVGYDAFDLSIPVGFGAEQVSCFGAPLAEEKALTVGSFVGDVRRGGSCNCATYTMTPHCNGTHTECVGHIIRERLNVAAIHKDPFCLASLITVQPELAGTTSESSTPATQLHDLLITRAALQAGWQRLELRSTEALVIRTLPNDPSKRTRNYLNDPAPYFTAEAMRWIVEQAVEHLVVDLPSLDRAEDEGHLTAHRIFWNVAAGASAIGAETRTHATVTELAYVPDHVPDGLYALNLQIAPLNADAAPSRPLLMTLKPT